jgi:hypothetical protein
MIDTHHFLKNKSNCQYLQKSRFQVSLEKPEYLVYWALGCCGSPGNHSTSLLNWRQELDLHSSPRLPLAHEDITGLPVFLTMGFNSEMMSCPVLVFSVLRSRWLCTIQRREGEREGFVSFLLMHLQYFWLTNKVSCGSCLFHTGVSPYSKTVSSFQCLA